MILAEKIAKLRKQNSWSQEELAEKLGISRQSVSKWESGASIPDLDRIIRMSGLFGVSTDYLLKDELEEIIYSETDDGYETGDGEVIRSVSLEEANTFMEMTEKISKNIALAVFILILSPVCLIFLGGLSELTNAPISEDMAGGIGVAILLVMVATAVAVLIFKGMQLTRYEYLEKEKLALEYGVEGIVRRKKGEYEPVFRRNIALGVAMIILGIVPLMIAAAFRAGDMIYICCVDFLLFVVACAVYIFIRSGSVFGSYQKLLQEGDYTSEKKAAYKRNSAFAGAYWCIVTAIFLGASFWSGRWELTVFIWPVAGVLFAAVSAVLKAVNGQNRKN